MEGPMQRRSRVSMTAAKGVPSDGVDWDSGGESGHLLKMILWPRETFSAGVPIYFQCSDPPHLTVV